MGKEIVIYTTEGCLRSARMMALLRGLPSLTYKQVSISDHPLALDELAALRGGNKAIPCIFFGSEWLNYSQFLSLSLDEISAKAQDPEPAASPSHQLDLNENGTVSSPRPSFLPTPKKRPPPVRHIKFNIVLDDVINRLKSPENGIASFKKKGKNKSSFKASEMVGWLEKYNKSKKDAAISLAEKLRVGTYIIRAKEKDKGNDKPFADDNTAWQFVADRDPSVFNNKVIAPPDVVSNTGTPISRKPVTITTSLLTILSGLVQTHTLDSGAIDSAKLLQHKQWKLFKDELHELNLIEDPASGGPKNTIVFFVQLYQILRLHLFVMNGGYPESKADLLKFVSEQGYRIHGMKYTLSAIINVLRTAKIPSESKQKGIFAKESKVDRRKREQTHFAVDLRIHFLLMHPALFSQPLVQVTERNFDFALQWDAELFCSFAVVSLSGRKVTLPRCFQVIASDASKNGVNVLEWIVQFLPGMLERKLTELLLLGVDNIAVEYATQSWERDLQYFPSLNFSGYEAPLEGNLDQSEEDLDFGNLEDSETPEEVTEFIAKELPLLPAALDLSGKALSSIPSCLIFDRHTSLRRVDVSENKLTTLPYLFGEQLQGIASLILAKNKLKAIPHCLGQLTNLEFCDLSDNNVKYIPNQFCALRNLKHLKLGSNSLATLPIGFAQLRSLEELDLSSNALETLPHNFGELVLMESLDLHSNRLVTLPDLSTLVLLEDLAINMNRLKDIQHLCEHLLPSLVTLDASHNEIRELPKSISQYVFLQELNLAHNSLKYLPSEVCDLYSIRSLDLEDNDITDPVPKVWTRGIEQIRNHFEWKKPLPPRKVVKTGRSGSGPPSLQNTGKSLSVREKRALLMNRTKTAKTFDKETLTSMRDRFGASDINSMFKPEDFGTLAKNATPRKAESTLAIKSPAVAPSVTEIPLSPREALAKASKQGLTDFLVKFDLTEGYWTELPGSLPSLVYLQEFKFLPDYQQHFFHKAHTNFLGEGQDGPIVISILDFESEKKNVAPKKETTEQKRAHTSRSKSLAAFGTKRLARKMRRKVSRLDSSGSHAHFDKSEEDFRTLKARSFSKDESPPIRPKRSSSTVGNHKLVSRSPDFSMMKASISDDVAVVISGGRGSTNSKPPDSLPKVQYDAEGYPLSLRCLIRTPSSDTRVLIPVTKRSKVAPKHFLKTLKESHPQYSGISFKAAKPESKDELLTVEMRLMVKGFKFGVLLAKEGQVTENEYFNNIEGNESYLEFLEFIGTKISLAGWKDYNAGLDTERDSTGTHSYHTTFADYSVMFHVATMLPFTEDDDQQLARKRHLGNDVVLIIFQEGDDHPLFDPRIIHSYFNHIFLVVRKDKAASAEAGVTMYRFNVIYKDGVETFRPGFPNPPLFEKNDETRALLLTKLINAERAAYSAPGFVDAITRTRIALLKNAFEEMGHHNVSPSQNSAWS